MEWFKTKEENGKIMVFDPIRKIYCVLTPEERVRQKILWFLVEHRGVPTGLLAVEYFIKVNSLSKRCDAVVFNRYGDSVMIVECKAEKVQITQKVLDQAIRYYSGLHVKYLLLTNGKTTFCYHIEPKKNSIKALEVIPMYEEM